MKIVLQRVKSASVAVEGRVKAEISTGLCLLVGIEKGDGAEDASYLADKVVELRIFPDEQGRMNRGLREVGGEVLAVSQFTLAGSVLKGRRPSFDGAEEPVRAAALFERFVDEIRRSGITVRSGVFAARMEVRLVNDGPVTFYLDSRRGKN